MKLNYKILNTLLILLIIFVLTLLRDLVGDILLIIYKITIPFILSFVLAYAINPAIIFLERKGCKKGIAISLIAVLFISLISLLSILVFPLLIDQLTDLFSSIVEFTKTLTENSTFNFFGIQDKLSDSFDTILSSGGGMLTTGILGVINTSLGLLTSIFIVFSTTIYFLIDMEDIRNRVKKTLKKRSKKTYAYIKTLDQQMKLYFTGFFRVILITITEYTMLYTIIGHPNAILIGVLAGFANLIPIFGGMIVNIIGIITALVVSTKLAILVGIIIIITTILDSYVINPLVFKKTNQVPSILILFSVFAFGTLFGIVGIVISIPVTIIIMSTYKFYKEEIEDGIEEGFEKITSK